MYRRLQDIALQRPMTVSERVVCAGCRLSDGVRRGEMLAALAAEQHLVDPAVSQAVVRIDAVCCW
jgi:hypothetical protein